MMNISSAVAVNYSYTNAKIEEVKNQETSFKDTYEQKTKKEYKSAVAEFKKRHPENTRVDVWVRSGKNHIKRCGADKVSRDNMTMEEYKAFFMGLMDKIPYDPSQSDTKCMWSMTEEGWEQMKNDPDYEAWVLGYTVEDRSVHFPFQATHINFEKFGATIEEHHGEGFNIFPEDKGDSGKKKESWWQKRHKKMEEFYKEQQIKAYEKSSAERKSLWERINQEQAQRSLIMQEYLSERTNSTQYMSEITGNNITKSVSAGIGAYESVLDFASSSK